MPVPEEWRGTQEKRKPQHDPFKEEITSTQFGGSRNSPAGGHWVYFWEPQVHSKHLPISFPFSMSTDNTCDPRPSSHKYTQGQSGSFRENMWIIHHHSLQKPPQAHVLVLMSHWSHSQTLGAAESASKKAARRGKGFLLLFKSSWVWASESIKSLIDRRLDGRTGCLLCV